ncbi:hypothetical protein BD779DRAFT_1475535 [Infundibulicybe gibba]|nr:hypothetical protein BD779DRAFT_1475535 [Infundibulicybe gibba]
MDDNNASPLCQLLDSPRRRVFWSTAIAFTAIYAQTAIRIMATSSSAPRAQSQAASGNWTDEETAALLNYLFENKSKSGDAGNFKGQVFKEAAKVIPGAGRTANQCQTRWTTLKTIYSAIQQYQARSGVHWDDEHGASIGDSKAAGEVWDKFIASKKTHPMRQFRDKGWNWLATMESIIPIAGARGEHVFSPSQTNPSPPIDGDDDIDGATQDPIATDPPPPATPDRSMSLWSDITGTSQPSNSSISATSGKRKHANLVEDTSSIPPSRALSIQPPRKKKNSSRSASQVSSSLSTSHMGVRTQNMDTAQVVAVYEINEGINRVASVMERALQAPTPNGTQETILGKAVRLTQEQETGLSASEKAFLIKTFTNKPKMAESYVGIFHSDVRAQFVGDLLLSMPRPSPLPDSTSQPSTI